MAAIEKYDLIVVGAGPAGTAAALVAARAGLKVIIFERGEAPGSKNMFGGVLFGHEINELIPNFWETAPIERFLIEERYFLVAGNSATTIANRSKDFAEPPYNGCSVLRARFDKWFSDQAVEAGALLVTETLVESLIMQEGQCVGVRTGRADGDVYADCVIVAEGVNSLLTRDIGVHREWGKQEVGVGVKELIKLPKDVLENRFNLTGQEGISMRILGLTKGMTGGVFLYTNKDTISLGIVTMIEDLVAKGYKPNDLMEEIKANPMIAPLIEGGSTVEYTAHMVPEQGLDSVPQLVHNGLLIVGDAAMISNLLTGEGVNLAVTTGRLAAEAVIAAKAAGDFSSAGLYAYQTALDNSYVMKDLKQFRGFAGYLHSHPDLMELYPQLANDFLKGLLTADGTPRGVKAKALMAEVKKKKSLFGIAKDLWRGWRVIK
jgi:electron transfer flavoprotein-quinone oxidoreductase